jgi:hypothetical protein
MKRWRLMMLLSLAGCSGWWPAGQTQSTAGATGVEAGRDMVPVEIAFDPPLNGRGDLTVLHESGWEFDGMVPPTGLSLEMPEGPASLRLFVGGQVAVRQIKIGPQGLRCVWRWQP